jgi:phosphopantothenate---cysteine ligase (CTP)
MKPQYNILVTSGGTQEYIDDVRVMTNISSGKLGSMIATNFAQSPDYHVHFVYGKNTIKPTIDSFGLSTYPVKSAQEAFDRMKELIPIMDAVIHCMAVSDFTFKRDEAIKCKSSDPEAFIEYMRKTITLNPKIISHIKEWNPDVLLVGFKFEVGATEEQLISLAKTSIEKNKCDMVIANDKKEMERLKDHMGHFFFAEKMKKLGFHDFKVNGKDSIAAFIYSSIMWALARKND